MSENNEGDERNLWDRINEIRANPPREFSIMPNLTIEAIVERREFLGKNVPKCPNNCEEKEYSFGRQVQLLHSSVAPAIWRCRDCKHKFEFEPIREK